MTPQELVLAAQRGDRDAFAELWRLHHRDIMRLVYRRTSDQHLAEDLTSEAFLRAWKGLPSFVWTNKGFGGWVATIARHLVADHYGSPHHRRSFLHNEFTDPDTDRRTDPEQVAIGGDLADALDRALVELSPDQREVLALRFGDGRSLAETAHATHRNVGATKAVQHRALVALRKHPAIAAVAA